MQAATKQQQQQQQHSPLAKKGLSSNGSNNNKSVAQRVMEMASNSNIYHLTAPIEVKSASTSNSLASDLEVEDLTGRASKLDLSQQTTKGETTTTTTNTTTTNSTTGDHTPQHQQQQSSLLNDQNNNNNSNSSRTCSVTSNTNNDTTISAQSNSIGLSYNSASTITPQVSLISSEAVFRQVVSSKKLTADELIQSPRGSSISGSRSSLKAVAVQDMTRISLDTKVPHPSKTVKELKAPEEEEVSYYNSQATTTTSLAMLDKPLPLSNANSFETSNGMQNGLSNEQTGPKCRSIFKETHNLSITVPTSCSSQQQLRQSQQLNNNINNNNIHLTSREYLHQVDEDDYDTRYDNAMVENAMTGFTDKQNQSSSSSVSNPTSPKCKSAPTTPCNVTPTAFHQHTSHLNSMFVPRPANTLPPDIRKNISATCRVVPSSVGFNSHTVSSENIDDLFTKGEVCMKNQDYPNAIRFLSQGFELAKRNPNIVHQDYYKLLSYRAEAFLNEGQYKEAIDDSVNARDLNPKWTEAYYIQGRARFLLGEHEDSLAIFSFGLTHEPSNKRLFEALVDAALKSRFKTNFEPRYLHLKSLGLDRKPFVVVSVLGQELLVEGHLQHAAIILESALKLSPDEKKFRASVLSTVSYAYYVMKNYEKAIAYMQKELEVEYEVGEVINQCKVLSNLGYTYYKMRKFDKSIEVHREQVKVAMHNNLLQQAAAALNAMGHVHMARNDLDSALTSHTNCLTLLRSLNNEFSQYKEILALGHIHAMKADYKLADEKYNEAFQLLQTSKTITKAERSIGYIMVNFNRAYLALKSRCFSQASDYYASVVKLAQEIPDPQSSRFKMRAFNGLGQTQRLFRKIGEAQQWFKKQLHYAEQIGDRVGQSQALCNLGMTYQHMKIYHTAREYFKRNLELVEGHPLLSAYAYSYLGSMCFLDDCYREAEAHYEKSLAIFKELEYCTNERKTIELNLAAVYERMGHTEMNIHSNSHQKKLIPA